MLILILGAAAALAINVPIAVAYLRPKQQTDEPVPAAGVPATETDDEQAA